MASILLVADRAGAHERLRSALVIAGHDVVVSAASSAGGRFDLALVDCGEAAAAEVVGAVRPRASRVVLYSEGPEDELRARAQRAGATGHLARGGTARDVLEQLHQLLRRTP